MPMFGVDQRKSKHVLACHLGNNVLLHVGVRQMQGRIASPIFWGDVG